MPDQPETMIEAAQRFRAAVLRVIAAFERGVEPLYRRLGFKRTASGLLDMARRNEAEADLLDGGNPTT